MTIDVKPDNYLALAIITTVLCCLPFGIVAIVYASKVDAFWYGGLHEEALNASNKAKKWSIISAASSLVIILLYFIFFVGMAATIGLD